MRKKDKFQRRLFFIIRRKKTTKKNRIVFRKLLKLDMQYNVGE